MKKIRLLFLLLLFFVIFAVFGIPSSAYAENESGLTSTLVVSPMHQSIILVPGEKYEGMIEVANPAISTMNLEYKVTVAPFSQHASNDSLDDYGTVDLETKNNYNQIIDWIEMEKDTGVVEPNCVSAINFVIDVPEDAPAGGQYVSLLVMKTDAQDDSVSKGISIQDQAQIASIIYAEVAGQTVKKGAILENSIPSFLLGNSLKATSMVRNDGNVHTDAEYIFQVWPLFSDEEICTNEESVSANLVMPETKLYHQETCKLPLVGIFRAKQTVRIFGEESVVERTVIVCPLWLMFMIIFVIAAIIIYFFARAKARKNKKPVTAE